MAESVSSKSQKGSCIFCTIAIGQSDSTVLLYNDDNYVCFKDIKPDAPFHYLVIPKHHLLNVKYLTKEHIPIIQSLYDIGLSVIKEQCCGDDISDIITGFHWPPFSSVEHLHLHVLGPVSQMSFIKRNLIFRKDSMAFVTVDWTLNYLKDK